VETAFDLDSGFRWGKANLPFFFTSNRCIPDKNTLDSIAVMFCVCDIIQLFSVAYWMFRAEHKFHFRLVVTETHVFGKIYCFSPNRRRQC
jgi:hypothetical protein